MAAVADNAYKGTLVPHSKHVVPVLLEHLKGRTWDGKEDVVQALVATAVACTDHFALEENKSVNDEIVAALLKEAGKSSPEYKLKVLQHLAVYLEKVGTFAHLEKVADIANAVYKNTDGSDDDDDEADANERHKKSQVRAHRNHISYYYVMVSHTNSVTY